MSLSAGTRLGPYVIEAPIGAGGMGEVYRARDTKLDRVVALKVLPDSVAADPDRLSRFEREAKIVASLNHPHIAQVYGVIDAPVALIMELVEGEDLAARVGRGPLPLDEALRVARQIADALDAAHEKGIVHRDLKPANVRIRPDGVVKVLDFGLAKALAPAAAGASLAASITSPAMTEMGMILGTAAYMSPEQARGKASDKRADIWAFGCVLFELLTGARAFEGESMSDTLAAVLTRDPAWAVLPPMPGPILKLLRRCLEKDPRRRLADIADARLEIDDVQATPPSDAPGTAGRDRSEGWGRVVPWGLAVAGLAAACVMLLLWAPWRQPPGRGPVHLSVELDPEVGLTRLSGGPAVFSPAGDMVAFVGLDPPKAGNKTTQLYVRRLSELQAVPLTGTSDARSPFFSPDGQAIAFFGSGKLKRIPVTGGSVVTLCDAPAGRGGAWAEDGTIAFSPDKGSGVRLLRVVSNGGKPEPLTSLVEGEVSHRWPQWLPGGHAVLYTASHSPADYGDANIVVQALPSGRRKVVWKGGYFGRYLPSGAGRGGGHLLYIRDGTLYAVPFDLDRLEVTGEAVHAREDVASSSVMGEAQFDVSAGGMLLYLPQPSSRVAQPIHTVDRDGKTTLLRATPANWANLLFSPDGRRLAMQIDDVRSHVWIDDVATDTLRQLTFDPGTDTNPVWLGSGAVVFASTRGGNASPNLWWQRADGTGAAVSLTPSKNPQRPESWDPAHKLLAFTEQNKETASDVMIMRLVGDDASGWTAGPITPFLNEGSAELDPRFSPDGRWLAYVESGGGGHGPPNVWVRSFPGKEGPWQISPDGGELPTWSPKKPELFFGDHGKIMVVDYTVEGDAFRPAPPRPWSGKLYLPRSGGHPFALDAGGERFALALDAQALPEARTDHMVFIPDFFQELRRIAPVTKH